MAESETMYCSNRIFICGQEVEHKGLCKDCFSEVPRYALYELLDSLFTQFEAWAEYPARTCPICANSTRLPICKDCYDTIQSIGSSNIIVTR